ncbi:MAG: hypothetical protein FWF81_12670 [Defluviitaleaceae bacterium]|nr:hypothetical protein [Defluviitaleaceae bacterium]
MIKELQQQHDKQNEEYVTAKAKLFAEKKEGELNNIANARLDKLSEVLNTVSDLDKDPYVETLDLFVSFFDDVILECVVLTNRREVIENKIIDIAKEIISHPTKNKSRNTKEEHVTAIIVDSLNSKKSTSAISKEMANALLDETNPMRLGLSLYVNFCEKNPKAAVADALDYLQTENSVRTHLISGNDSETFAALEKLIASPIKCPEKYLLTALNSFYHGFDNDAKRALDIGLHSFPNNERLLSAKKAIGG